QLAEMYREEGRRKEAVVTLLELRDGGYLDAAELCQLAQLQARVGDPKGAFETLRRVQEADPDDVEAKAVEAEALLVSGEYVLATRLMDRLLKEHPDLASARLLRARYFFNRDYIDEAAADLERIQGQDSLSPEVVTLKAGVCVRRHQLVEAEKLLQ